jgi:hypothetical protein
MTAFEDGLWERLVDEHDADNVKLTSAKVTTSHRRPVFIGGGLTAMAGAIASGVVALTAATTAPPAYALIHNSDGSVTVTIHNLETAIPELNAKFRALGIDETVVPVTANCPTHNGSASWLNDPMFAYPQATTNETVTLGPGRKHLEAGFNGVMAAEQLASGEVAIAIEAIPTRAPNCFPTAVYTVRKTGATSSGVPNFDVTPVTRAGDTTPGG